MNEWMNECLFNDTTAQINDINIKQLNGEKN